MTHPKDEGAFGIMHHVWNDGRRNDGRKQPRVMAYSMHMVRGLCRMSIIHVSTYNYRCVSIALQDDGSRQEFPEHQHIRPK